jgi:chromosome partitioning protein
MGKLKEEEIMCKVISVVNQKGGVGYEKLHIMQSR